MTNDPNLIQLVEAGREAEAIALLYAGITLRPVIGERSARAALEFSKRLADGNLDATARWMTKYRSALRGVPRDIAEESDEGLQQVLTFIKQIEHGVYV